MRLDQKTKDAEKEFSLHNDSMPLLELARLGKILVVEKGSNLMKTLLASGVPVASSCGGDGICGKCRLRVIAKNGNLPSPNPTESALSERIRLDTDERISCQIQIEDDLEVDAAYW